MPGAVRAPMPDILRPVPTCLLAAASVPYRRDYYATIKCRLRLLKVESESVENTAISQPERREDTVHIQQSNQLSAGNEQYLQQSTGQ